MIELCQPTECTGCGACVNACPRHAIKMVPDSDGFMQPLIDISLCVECSLCQKVCHVLNPIVKHKRADNPLAAIAKSIEICEKSSSGGIFSVISSFIFSQKGVVFGAVLDENFNLYHTKAENESELDKLRGSKYFQSNILDTYKQVKSFLKQERFVLFTGTACQIAGLYSFLRNSNSERLYTLDLVCHGVPSRKSFVLYLTKLAEKKRCNLSSIKGFSFRNLKGWNYSPSYYINGSKYSHQPENDLYMRLFLSSRISRECCYKCMYSTPERVSDITIADFWGIGATKSFQYDTSKGCSLVLLNSEKGEFLFRKVSTFLNFEKRDWSEALAQNHQLHTPSLRPSDRSGVLRYLEEHTYDQTYNHYFNNYKILAKKIIRKILTYFRLKK